jgi:hypothetical protein
MIVLNFLVLDDHMVAVYSRIPLLEGYPMLTT